MAPRQTIQHNFFIKPNKKSTLQNSINKRMKSDDKQNTENFFLENSETKQGKRSSAKYNENLARDQNPEKADQSQKKPFDKKAWRLKKYSKKYKLKQWEERRKHAVQHEYNKMLKRETNEKLDVKTIYEKFDNDEPENDSISKNRIPSKRKPSLESLREMKRAAKEEKEQQKSIKESKRQEYKKRKLERFKILSQKTKKGQPIMKGRIELLLGKIQRNIQN